jgi:hypothetical protein
MRVNATQELTQSLLQSMVTGEKSPAGFQATLGNAQQNLAQVDHSVTLVKTTERKEDVAPAVTYPKTPGEELAEYLRKTPAQHMRDAILKKMGLSEEALAALPPEQHATIEKTITDKIKERLQEQSGNTKNQTQSPLPVHSIATQSLLMQGMVAADNRSV